MSFVSVRASQQRHALRRILITAVLFASSSLGVLAGTSRAGLVTTLDDIQYWVGSGANRAAFVIDWNDGKTDESIAWGYRWDGAAKGIDMLRAIVAADPRLFAHLSTSSNAGAAVYGFGYDLDGDGDFGVSPALAFDAGGQSAGAYVNGRAPTDAADHWREGWTSGYWSYWAKTPTATNWAFSGGGVSTKTLVNDGWDGWSFVVSGSSAPSPAMAALAVPEPASWLLFAGGMSTLWIMRRRSVA